MTAYAMPTSPAVWDHTPWQRWAAEVAVPLADAATWAARLLATWLAALAAVLFVWPVRLVARWWAWAWADPERLVCSVVFAGPVGLLVRTLPRVDWPSSYAEALADLQTAGGVLVAAFLLLTFAQMPGTGSGRQLVASPDGTRTRRWVVAVHEAGHLVIGKALGRKTFGARIYASGGGLTQVEVRRDDPKGEIAIDWAGMYAAGTQWGGEGDKANARSRLRYVEPGRRGGLTTAGKALSRRLVRENRPEIMRTARTLYRAPDGTVVR